MAMRLDLIGGNAQVTQSLERTALKSAGTQSR
jgi:hypothetical protein